jgi:hypothetical protein
VQNNSGLKLALAALGLSLASGAQAVDGQLTFAAPWGPNGGGEFIVTSSTGFGAFKTFCLEFDEHLNIPGTYDYTINSKAMGGGPGYDPNGDPLSIGTAWLYSQFASGNLATTYAYDTAADQGELQKAIWWLEEESSAPGYATGSLNPWVDLAKAELGLWDDVLIRANANGAYGVVALNLDPTGSSDARRQDVLAVPDGGLTLGLLGFGLLAVGWTRRRSA